MVSNVCRNSLLRGHGKARHLLPPSTARILELNKFSQISPSTGGFRLAVHAQTCGFLGHLRQIPPDLREDFPLLLCSHAGVDTAIPARPGVAGSSARIALLLTRAIPRMQYLFGPLSSV